MGCFEKLKQMEMDKSDEVLKHVKGKMFLRPPNKVTANLNKKINEATNRFDENEDVKRYLEYVDNDDNDNDFDENSNFERSK